MIELKLDEQDFGTICICALRYAMGRETYMPGLVRDFVRPLLPKLPDNTLSVMDTDCEYQAKYNNYGNERIDKPGWVRWAEEIKEEINRRQKNDIQKQTFL